MERHTLTFTLTSPEALALAQYVKRTTWDDVRAKAANDEEIGLMQGALSRLEEELKFQGFSPR